MNQEIMRAHRKRRRSDDPFFLPGDTLALENDGTIVLSYLPEEHVTTPVEKELSCSASPSLPFSCSAPHCKERFGSLYESQLHYESHHRFECNECGAIYPNEFLLDIVSL